MIRHSRYDRTGSSFHTAIDVLDVVGVRRGSRHGAEHNNDDDCCYGEDAASASRTEPNGNVCRRPRLSFRVATHNITVVVLKEWCRDSAGLLLLSLVLIGTDPAIIVFVLFVESMLLLWVVSCDTVFRLYLEVACLPIARVKKICRATTP